MDVKISIVKLNNENYQSWAFKMECILVRDGNWKFVNPGTPPVVNESSSNTEKAALEVWIEGDSRAKATIALCTEDSQHNLIMGARSAKDSWDRLQRYHHKATLTSKVSLLKKICSKNFLVGDSMEQHIFEMEELFRKLENAGQVLLEPLKVAMILRGLPEEFDTLAITLENRSDEDLTLEMVRGKLLDFVSRSDASESQNKALRVKSYQKPIPVCFKCHKKGHIQRDCWSKDKELEESDEKSTKNQKASVAKQEYPMEFALGVGATCDNEDWLVDSGATSHMTPNKDLFDKLDESHKSNVGLGNGETEKVEGIGNVKITVNGPTGLVQLNVQRVLFVPDLANNLLSVSKIIKAKNEIEFDEKGCTIMKNGRKIARAIEYGDTYILKTKMETARNVSEFHRLEHKVKRDVPESVFYYDFDYKNQEMKVNDEESEYDDHCSENESNDKTSSELCENENENSVVEEENNNEDISDNQNQSPVNGENERYSTMNCVVMATESIEPSCNAKAIDCQLKEKWIPAMQEEMKFLQENNPLQLVPLPVDRGPFFRKWMFQQKVNENDELEEELEDPKSSKYHLDPGFYKHEDTRPTRPDLATSVLSREIKKPTAREWTEARRIVKYLKGASSKPLSGSYI